MRKDPDSLAVPDPTAVAEGELAKSGTTRRRILESARDLLATSGYAGFSTAAVAEGAGLTRPAMLYHFGSRQELLNATINFLVRRRIELFREQAAAATARHGTDTAAIRLEIVDIAFAQARGPEQLAFQELVSASRTDPELAAVMAPAAAFFDTLRSEATRDALPPDQIAPHNYQLVRDVVRFVTEGTARAHAFTFDEEERMKALRQFLRLLVAHQTGGDFVGAVASSMDPDGASPPPGMPPWPSSD
jgi:AcrR family transcriptional regulator